MTQQVQVANAPCSYGAFEITVGVDPLVPAPLAVLDAIQQAGYAGTDLGPLGYLGAGRELADRLAARGLRLAGGYLEMPYSRPELMGNAMRELEALLDVFDAVTSSSSQDGVYPPRPTLADAGSDERRAAPGRAQKDRQLGLRPDGWAHLAEGVTRAVEACRARGYEPTFHHHAATYIEAPWEIEELLNRTEVGLCLDTGHLLLAGGDPVQGLADWGERINHLHIKDARLKVIEGIVKERAPVEEVWRRGAFCPLGQGDLDIDEVLARLKARPYRGWLVVEQDTIPNPARPSDEPAWDQARNREFLRTRGF